MYFYEHLVNHIAHIGRTKGKGDMFKVLNTYQDIEADTGVQLSDTDTEATESC